MVDFPTSLPPYPLSPRKPLAPHSPAALRVCLAICLILSLSVLLSLFPTASRSAYLRHRATPPPPTAIASTAPVAAARASELENEKDKERHWGDALPPTPDPQAGRRAPRAADSESSSSSSDDDENPAEHICPNLILISAARHGSTWFVDSASACMYSRGLSGTFRQDVFQRTEIWTKHPGPVQHISPRDALQYVLTNSSVKFMPSTIRAYGGRAEELLRLAKREGVPVVVLRRRAVEAFRSRQKARDRGDWRAMNYIVRDADADGGEGKRKQIDEDDAKLTGLVKTLEKHFGMADDMLEKVGNTLLDRFDYDDVKDEQFIHARRSACYIRNCNFVED